MESISTDGLIVIGMTIVMIAGGFDLSVGAVMAMGGVTAIVLLPFGLPIGIAGRCSCRRNSPAISTACKSLGCASIPLSPPFL